MQRRIAEDRIELSNVLLELFRDLKSLGVANERVFNSVRLRLFDLCNESLSVSCLSIVLKHNMPCSRCNPPLQPGLLSVAERPGQLQTLLLRSRNLRPGYALLAARRVASGPVRHIQPNIRTKLFCYTRTPTNLTRLGRPSPVNSVTT